MNKRFFYSLLLFVMLFFTNITSLRAQSTEVKQLLLNVEKLEQFRNILKDMKQGYQILRAGYTAVSGIAQGNFNLHQTFLDGLLDVSPSVRNYYRVAQIIRDQRASQDLQVQIEKLYRDIAPGDITGQRYITRVLRPLKGKTMKGLDDLLMILTPMKMRMNDEERLAAIDRIADRVEEEKHFLRRFRESTLARARQHRVQLREIEQIRQLNTERP
ncbi:MAG: TerB family tellurite resistance protein [Mucilaginibacter polytrichastri]|nr:TerB family tellurite resistance protein [Mucilaginibacter polytrichastri]